MVPLADSGSPLKKQRAPGGPEAVAEIARTLFGDGGVAVEGVTDADPQGLNTGVAVAAEAEVGGAGRSVVARQGTAARGGNPRPLSDRLMGVETVIEVFEARPEVRGGYLVFEAGAQNHPDFGLALRE